MWLNQERVLCGQRIICPQRTKDLDLHPNHCWVKIHIHLFFVLYPKTGLTQNILTLSLNFLFFFYRTEASRQEEK